MQTEQKTFPKSTLQSVQSAATGERMKEQTIPESFVTENSDTAQTLQEWKVLQQEALGLALENMLSLNKVPLLHFSSQKEGKGPN